MGLAEALARAPKGREYKKQAVDVVLEQVDGDDRAALLAALTDPAVTAPVIGAALRDNGFMADIKDPAQAVRTWRARNRG